MISQEAVNFISEKVYNEDPTTWMPESFITSSPSLSPKNNYDISSPLYKGVPAILSLFHLLRSPNYDVVIMPRH